MSEEKQYPPTELKLDRLRSSGVIPTSSDVLTAGSVVGFFVAIYGIAEPGFLSYLTYARSVWALNMVENPTKLSSLFSEGSSFWTGVAASSSLLGCFVISIAVAVVAAGLLQTRALISPKALSFDISRLFAFPRNWKFFSLAGQAALSVLKACLCLFLLLLLVRQFCVEEVESRDPLSISDLSASAKAQRIDGLPKYSIKRPNYKEIFEKNNSAPPGKHILSDKINHYWKFLRLAGGLLSVVAFFVALCSYLLAYYSFYREHRMTRRELEAEYREMEQSSFMRESRDSLREML